MDQKSRPTSILKVTIKSTNSANTKHLYRPNICTTMLMDGGAFARNNFKAAPWDDINFCFYFGNAVVYNANSTLGQHCTNVRLYQRFVFAGNNSSPKRAFCLENVVLIIKLSQIVENTLSLMSRPT